MKSKGQVEIQFNWIFVLAAGAIILIVFGFLIIKGKSSSDRTTNLYLSKNIKSIFANAESSINSLNEIDVPQVDIEMTCSGYRIGGMFEKIGILNYFSHNTLKGGKLITWTLSWDVPYRVTNFLYLTTPQIRYVIIGSGPLVDNLKDSMQDNLDKLNIEFVDTIFNIQYQTREQTRLVFINENPAVPSLLNNAPDKDVTALRVDGDSYSGNLRFYNKQGGAFIEQGTSNYLRLPSLIGAIFTNDLEMYNCVMQKTFNSLNIVSSIYSSRTSQLNNFYGGSLCGTHYSTNHIDNIIQGSLHFNQGNIVSINAAAQGLENQNLLAQRSSCALIY